MAKNDYTEAEIAKYGYRLKDGSVLLPGHLMMDLIRRGLAEFKWGK